MLYVTPLLLTTMRNYPEELSIQLQVVEAMHRIIHLPLSCWADALASEEGEAAGAGEGEGEHTSDDDTGNYAAHQVRALYYRKRALYYRNELYIKKSCTGNYPAHQVRPASGSAQLIANEPC